jgi:hypothetical protein
MVYEADVSRPGRLRVYGVGRRWWIELERGRLCLGDDCVTVAQPQTAAAITLDRERSVERRW